MPKLTRQKFHFKRKPNTHKEQDEGATNNILLTLENNKRFAHTATCSYQLTMASLQPDNKRLPNCACSVINQERRDKVEKRNRVIVIVEHNLNEYILCILDQSSQTQCKLDLVIQPGEQVAFRIIGDVPVMLSGLSSEICY